MIVQDHFLKRLRAAFDLNIYEVKIWTALLSRGVATAGELSEIGDVPRSRAYDVLESLEKKGFIIMKLGKPIKYLAVKPEEILKRVKTTIQIEADSKLKSIDKVKEEGLFKDLELLFKQGVEHIDHTTMSGAIRGRDNIYLHLSSLLQDAEKQVIIATSAEEFLRKLQNLRLRFKKLGSKGIKIKVVIPKMTEEIKKELKDLNSVFQIKVVPTLNSRFIIVDGKDVMFMVNDDKNVHESYDTAIWVTTPFFAKSLESMFNSFCDTIK
ncbi:MAG: helix-turn-helix domain-containing protein [Nanoarchaeota archaeon]